MSGPTSDAERERLDELHRYAILDTPPEKAFDELTALASALCETPIALVSLTDQGRQWFKSRIGLSATEIPRDRAFCADAIKGHGPLVVENTLTDPRFADHPLVIGELGIRFYAGAVLRNPRNFALGTLCVLDRVPRHLSAPQLQMLELLARQVSQQLELRRVNRELADSEVRYASILDRVGDALFCVGTSGQLTYASSAWASLMGSTLSSAVGTPLIDHFNGADQIAIKRLLKQARAGKTGTIEVQQRRADGLLTWIQVVSTAADPARYEGTVIGRLTDITRSKELEQQLGLDTERRRRLTTLFEKTQRAAHIGGWELDLVSSELSWTDETYRIHGFTPGEFSPTVSSAIDFYTPASRPKIQAAVEAAIATGFPYDLELELLSADGGYRWIRASGHREDMGGVPCRLYGTFQDITERRALEQAVLTAANQERERFGYELHEGIGQELTGAALLLRALTVRMATLDRSLMQDLQYATEIVNHSLESCRALAHQVTPTSPTRGGIEHAIRRLAERTQKVSGIEVRTVMRLDPSITVDPVTSDNLYLIAQEALMNAVKHSAARSIRLELNVAPTAIGLQVSDDGSGIEWVRGDSANGMGIQIMHHHARLINARLEIVSGPTKGTSVNCSIAN